MYCLFLDIRKWIIKQYLLNNNKLSKEQFKIIKKYILSTKVLADINYILSKIVQRSEGFSWLTAD